MPKLCLTSQIVDIVASPEKGEMWVGDNHLKHFGVRVWAGKNGGGKAFAIRLRDQFGELVREVYKPERDFPLYVWRRAWSWSLGRFLSHARRWARDRIAVYRGELTSEERRRRQWESRRKKVLTTRIGDAFEKRLADLRRASRDHEYVIQLGKLVSLNVPQPVLDATFRDVPVRRLADAISHNGISYGNVKVLRAFVGGVFEHAADKCGVLHFKLESIQRRCAKNLDARVEPPYSQILSITDNDYKRFFDALQSDRCWRPALALRLYFATGAKLQQVLRARWSDIVDGAWYPFTPDERKLWFESKERLAEEAACVIELIEARHREEELSSLYLFPSVHDAAKPIKTIQRHWLRFASALGWKGLPLSHVVLRHRPRSNPSYSLFFLRYYWRFGYDNSVEAVSKVANRRAEYGVFAVNYR